MSFKYSSFISYRRNQGDKDFLKNLKNFIRTEAQNVTGISAVFFDEDEIKWGQDFDEKIYESIYESYFFIPFYLNSYLDEKHNWCARELYHAIEVEKVIRKAIRNNNYCYILPIIYRGSASSLPKCICEKNAKAIRKYAHLIQQKNTTAKLTEFKEEIYQILLDYHNLIENENLNLKELCSNIKIPTDEEIKNWIKEQNKKVKENEANNPPILKKNAE